MSIYGQSTQSNNSGLRQGNFPPPTQHHQSSSSTSQAYPYQYPPRQTEVARRQNGVVTSQNQHDARHTSANGAHGTSSSLRRIDDTTQKSREVIHPNMQIPPAVNDSRGSIGELASQMTCFFWFEPIETLRKAESWNQYSSPIRRLGPDSIPTSSFRKWVILILSTTQVTPNVIILALLFIYRLKTLNHTVKGKPGSEYRLLTVALMLGNKFLDDNTYTNKTWAEVSGISVGEIHVMEVEFLSNMRYSLFASADEWDQWQRQLGKFAKYFELASKVRLPSPSTVRSGFLPPSSTAAMPVYSSGMVKADQSQPSYSAPYGSTLQAIPHQSADLAKKRSYEDIIGLEPAPKRSATMANRQAPTTLQSNLPLRNIPRLPVPNLSVSTNSNANYAGFPQSLPPLPPMNGRAIAQVYPSTPSWTPPVNGQQQQPAVSLPPPPVPSLSYTGALTPGMTPNYGPGGPIYSLPSSHQGTPSRRHSPRAMALQTGLHSGVHSMNSSPITTSFAQQELNNNSPSIFLQQRNSPYKPVRPPNKLLYAPPGNFQDYSQHHQPTIDQMHYQPLGRRNDYRTGIVPEFRGGPEPVPYWQQPFRQIASPPLMNYAAR